MPSTSATASVERADPARDRGLRRGRTLGPCPPVDPTPLPPPAEPVQVLALLTRVRAERVAAGELAAERLYDVRAFKCCYAELGYLRRLAAAGRAGGTVVTSMRQLVAGLAALHPAWEITGERFEDRDRHHRAVRRRLADLQAMGLLRWRIGTDLDGEERRTELELRPPPELSLEELEAAAHRLERWQARYGAALNTGSRTGIRNAAGHGHPLSAPERQRRGCQHARAAAASRSSSRGHRSNSAPPSGAPAPPENTSPHENASELRNACKRTAVRARNPQNPETTSRAETTKTACTEENGAGLGQSAPVSSQVPVSPPEPSQGPVFNVEAILARVREREVQRRPVLEAIADQANARALEVAGWGLDRGWPFSRLREAWVVARYGATAAADSGPAGAGPLYPDDYARLRRAVARYERNAAAAPEGYPAGGLAALLHLGTLASTELTGGPRTLRYAVGALDQLSRRMRALATAESASRHEAAAVRARRRREPPSQRRAFQLVFRRSWPPWIRTDEHGRPIFERGMLELDDDGRCPVPRADSSTYRMVVRDAYLLAGRKLPVDVDGRKEMALRHQRRLDPAPRRPRPSGEQLMLAELSHRTGQPISLLRRIAPSYREEWLARQRQEDAARARAEMAEFRQRIANIFQPRSQ